MDKNKVAENLVLLRGNLSRKFVAESVGISVSALAMYENGKRIPRDEIKMRLADFYNKKIIDIFFDN